MTPLVCRIGCTSDVRASDRLFRDPNILGDFFWKETCGKVSIDIDATPLSRPFEILADGAVGAFSLHTMLRKLTGNPLSRRPVDTIALIVARAYRGNPAAFGMMFDEGYVHDGDPADNVDAPEVLGPPREGCAVFIDAIAAKRGRRGSAAFLHELTFTALHELGHVFNLQHQNHENNVMKESAKYDSVPPVNFRLSEADRVRLSLNPLPLHHHPGGSDFGRGASASAPLVWKPAAPDVPSDLRLKVALSHVKAYPFEPVELDVEISLARDARGRRRIRNAVDPGYDSFRIWIEDPVGARRTLRSPRRYCGDTGWLTITRDRPFRRDISIGREAGGPVFRQGGVHRISAEINLGARGVLRSNAVPLRIRDLTEVSRADAAARIFLESRPGVVLGYSRLWCGSEDVSRRAMDLLSAFPNESWSPLLRYSILRASVTAARAGRRANPTSHAGALRELAAIAVDDPRLGEHRANAVREALDDISWPTRNNKRRAP